VADDEIKKDKVLDDDKKVIPEDDFDLSFGFDDDEPKSGDESGDESGGEAGDESGDESEEQKGQVYASDLDYISDAKAALIRDAPLRVRAGLLLMLLVIAFGLVWANFASIDEVVNANGKVIPTQQLQVVQHLEGGIVDQIMVDEGEKVNQDQVVVTLNATRWRAEYQRDIARMAVLDAEIARLEAQASGADKPTYPEELKKKHPKIVTNATKLFISNQDTLLLKITNLQKSYGLTKQELDIIAPLAKQGVMSKVDLLRLEKQLASIEGDIKEARDEASNEANERLNVVRADRNLLEESIKTVRDRMLRTEIRSPVKGTVNQVYVSTRGEVLRPAQRILDIVPGDSRLTIQARVKPDDIGFIKTGQKAVIKVTAYNFARYGGLDGRVVSISADSLSDDQGNLYYEVKLVADKMYVGTDERPLEITPGMTVMANITIGKKTVLEYMLKPFLKAKEEAFAEG